MENTNFFGIFIKELFSGRNILQKNIYFLIKYNSGWWGFYHWSVQFNWFKGASTTLSLCYTIDSGYGSW